MKFLKRFWWLILLGALVGGGFLMWKNAQAATIKAKSYIVKKQDLIETLSLSGEVDAKEKADIRFQTSGLLTWVGVKEGDTVKKYQAIAALDKRELQNSLNTYLNSYMKERWDFEQDQQNNKDWQTLGMTDLARDTIKRTLDKDQFDLNNSVLAVEARNLSLKFATIFSPFEGVITRVDVPQPGTNITPASAMFSVVNPNSLYFSATADQTEVPSLNQNMTGTVVLDSFPDIELPATIENIGFVPKEGESGTVYEIKVSFDQTKIGDKLKIGMTGDLDFTLKENRGVLAVPEAYVKKQDGKYFVTKMINGKLEKTEVEVGEIIEGSVVIKQGLNENDVIYNQP